MKPFTTLAVILLALLALVQLLRVFSGWVVTVNGMAVPLWASVVAFVIAAGLSVMVWRETSR